MPAFASHFYLPFQLYPLAVVPHFQWKRNVFSFFFFEKHEMLFHITIKVEIAGVLLSNQVEEIIT